MPLWLLHVSTNTKTWTDFLFFITDTETAKHPETGAKEVCERTYGTHNTAVIRVNCVVNVLFVVP
eukprot:6257268-Amphidinium_carterae.1